MGDGSVTNGFREKLERDLSSLEGGLKHTNNLNKPPPEEPDDRDFFQRLFGW